MRIALVDPPAYTPPYDRSLCAALARAGADVELITSHFAHGPVGGERDLASPAGAVLDHGFVRTEVERDRHGARAVRRRHWCGLPAAGGQAQRRMLELRLGRGKSHRELAEQLGVGVERVARCAPLVVREGVPSSGHVFTLHLGWRGSSSVS